MPASVAIYSNKEMSLKYGSDNSYSIPVKYGTLSNPLDGISGGPSVAFPIWVKNTGTTKLFNVKLFSDNGTTGGAGGEASSVHDAFVEFSLDNNSSLPNSQPLAPTVYEKATNSSSYTTIYLSNVIDSNGVKKSTTSIGRDDDSRTMLPGEYCIVWTRCDIDAARAAGESLPIDSGIYNIKVGIAGLSSSYELTGEVSLKASAIISLYAFSDFPGKIFIQTKLAYWRFNEGDGSTTEDSAGDNDGTIDGAVWWNIGIEGKSLLFDGTNSVSCGNDSSLNPSDHDYTIDCWFKIMDFVEGGSVISKNDGASGFDVYVDPSGVLNFYLKDNSGNSVNLIAGTVLNDTGWHYGAITVNRSDNIAIVYVNGNEDIQSYDISSLTGSVLNNSDLLIGDGSSNFIGRIDEVALYNRVLSNDEILTKYNEIWNAYLDIYAVTDDGNYVMDNGRHVVDEVF